MEHEIVAERDGVGRRARRSRSATRSPRASCWPTLSDAGERARRPSTPPAGEPDGRRRERDDLARRSASATRSASTPPGPRRWPGATTQGRRTARENLADLLDADSFVEYGPLMFAAQERRRSQQELIERTPADGLVGGVGAIAGEPVRGHVLRLHGPGRHPGDAQPPEEGPAVRGRRAPAAAGGAVRRGRRRAARRRRHADRGRPGLPRLSPVRAAQRPRAAGRDRLAATALPATPPCSAAATWSSPPRTRASGWAARR